MSIQAIRDRLAHAKKLNLDPRYFSNAGVTVSELEAALEEYDKLREILANIVSPGECRIDHHGYCQAHGWMSEEKCPHGKAREILQ